MTAYEVAEAREPGCPEIKEGMPLQSGCLGSAAWLGPILPTEEENGSLKGKEPAMLSPHRVVTEPGSVLPVAWKAKH